jgi:uracil-DNA glycosylase
MFSRSVRAFTQMIVEARTGDPSYGRSFDNWPRTLAAIESGVVDLEPPARLAQRWVDQGVLLLNCSLTLSRFKVEIDPHQRHGHLPLWRPFITAVMRAVGPQTVFVIFGDLALDFALLEARVEPRAVVRRKHPAQADAALILESPFVQCNRRLEAMGVAPIAW